MGRSVGSAQLSDHYAVLAKRGHIKAPQPPKLPPEVVHIWNTFVQLAAARGGSGFGPQPISYTEIEAFSRVMDMPLAPWEVAAIRALDDAYFEVKSETSP